MRKSIMILSLLCMTATTNAADNPGSEFIKNMVNGNHGDAIAQLQSMAEAGDTDAQYQLGYMYGTGSTVKRDLELSMAWYDKAARKGHKGAIHQLSLMKKRHESIKGIGYLN
ncbi:MAG: hypothetical protein OEZ10_05680 [Gammaproteobacteria bacterium]|nr:hypothetical protein [Gammaproteobacteria bacterium]